MNNQIQSPEVIVVEASAGSGKTFALAKRYLELAVNPRLKTTPYPLRNILAITFTNKATIEMKARILEFLKRIALDEFENKEQENEILGPLGVDKKMARELAVVAMESLINNYTYFQVKTIDSFINAILMGSALNIDRSAHFTIKHDYNKYLAYCLDNVISLAAQDKDALLLLKDFLMHYLSIENKNSWFPKKDILETIQALFKLNNTYGIPFHIYRVNGQDVIKKKLKIFNAISDLSLNLPQDLNGTVKKSILKFSEGNNIFELKNLPDKFKSLEIPMNKNKDAPPEFEKLWKNIHKEICELIELDADVVYKPYIQLFDKILEHFNKICKHDDVLFLGELNSKARLLFGEEGITIAEIYYRMATRFNHYLIDEFQDTSRLQWKNLEEMVREAISIGGSLFYVGDKKQAIYRFRGGDARLFDEVKDEFSAYVKPKSLTKNWRSQKAIIEFNNMVFAKENLINAISKMDIEGNVGDKEELIKHILGAFNDSQEEHSPDKPYGYVSVERIEEDKKEDRNTITKEKILPLLDKLKTRGFSYKDIAILCRDNDEVELITSWCLEKGISVESEKTLSIEENSLIQELVSFLTFLYSPIDDLSFAAFVLGDIFTKATGISQKEMTDFIFRLRKERTSKLEFALYRKLREHYPEVWGKYLDDFFKSVGFVSPYELVISIYERYSLMSNFPETQAFFMKFLELIKQQEEEYIGLGDLLSYLDTAQKEELYVNVQESDSIHVLTVHKSKGLEFGVVILPFLRIDVNAETGDIPGSYITPEGNSCGLVRITKEHRKYSERLKKIYEKAYIEACLNEFNNLYVALTRAKFEMYIFMPKKSASSSNKARNLIPETLKMHGQPRSYETKSKVSRPAVVLAPSSYTEYLSLIRDEFQDALSLKNRTKILQGNVMHFILSSLDNTLCRDKKNILDVAFANAKIKYPFFDNFYALEEKITRLIEDKAMRHFFYIEDDKLYLEKEIVDLKGNTKRIDRLIIKEREAWIIDYKSSHELSEKHITQMKEYIVIIKKMYPQKNVKGFLLYLDEIKFEEVNG
ncbi:MAG: UvrD-helicase domain-containing protein [Candidatus Omnitrophota bacterium]